jgi:hypothetical protein
MSLSRFCSSEVSRIRNNAVFIVHLSCMSMFHINNKRKSLNLRWGIFSLTCGRMLQGFRALGYIFFFYKFFCKSFSLYSHDSPNFIGSPLSDEPSNSKLQCCINVTVIINLIFTQRRSIQVSDVQSTRSNTAASILEDSEGGGVITSSCASTRNPCSTTWAGMVMALLSTGP